MPDGIVRLNAQPHESTDTTGKKEQCNRRQKDENGKKGNGLPSLELVTRGWIQSGVTNESHSHESHPNVLNEDHHRDHRPARAVSFADLCRER